MQRHFIVLMLVCAFVAIANAVKIGTQSYKVKGKLMCGNKPAKNVEVKLVDIDLGLNPDEELDKKSTDKNGYFELAGYTKEATSIDACIKIYHDCNDGIKPCQRKWKMKLPNSYITSGQKPKHTLDIGTWNLEVKLPDEERDCLH